MTQADDASEYFHSLSEMVARGDTRQACEAISVFMERTDWRNWTIDSVDLLQTSGLVLDVRSGSDHVKIAYDHHARRFHCGGKLVSDRHVCEILGVPKAFVEGMITAFEAVGHHVNVSTVHAAKAKEGRRKATVSRARLRHKIANVSRDSVLASEVKRSNKDLRTRVSTLMKEVRFLKGMLVDRPSPPRETVEPTGDAWNIPEQPGVYFIWEANGVVAYVGQSVNLNNRCRRNHERLERGDRFSWLCTNDNLNFVESHYIGLCKPWRNFGGHRKARNGST